MTNQQISSTEEIIKENLRYSPSCVTPMVNQASYSRHLSSRHERRFSNGKSQTIIHVTIRSPPNNSSQKENKSENTIDDSYSVSNLIYLFIIFYI
jgi:arginine repressor